MLPEQLITDRLLLSPPALADASAIIALANDPLIAEMTLAIPSPYGEADAVQFLHLVNTARKTETGFIYAIRSPEQRSFMGAVGLHLHKKYGHAEIGYWIGAPHRGQGYVAEAVGAVIDAGFGYTELQRIHAIHRIDNAASGGVLLHNRMTLEATLDDYMVKNGIPQTVRSYRILRPEWEARRTQKAN
ncbi:hypothetical protein LEM8419_01197 [Neolewinella maritima]|uniref:N-acetyltransferase domain-containing protein n=1 Tax=Neolewinella maritima TaxID=1383882 RepID=A0ABM9AZW3_9BACT|nr:GNAT family protein [Neolewinella maritima]CAH0999977.1 hypothetical protein LEM8419_01197 [Neolewinella maritima]